MAALGVLVLLVPVCEGDRQVVHVAFLGIAPCFDTASLGLHPPSIQRAGPGQSLGCDSTICTIVDL
jgi:hypothetical protein